MHIHMHAHTHTYTYNQIYVVTETLAHAHEGRYILTYTQRDWAVQGDGRHASTHNAYTNTRAHRD